jgi:hypothetical protein
MASDRNRFGAFFMLRPADDGRGPVRYSVYGTGSALAAMRLCLRSTHLFK